MRSTSERRFANWVRASTVCSAVLAGVDGEQEDKRHLQPAAKAIGDLGQPEPSRRPQDCEG